jgi:hypothetical protein
MRPFFGAMIFIFFGARALSQSAPAPGEKLYREGILPSGQSVTARREGDLQITGAAAACSNCHRRSGLGEIEGSIKIPPISGSYLFRRRTADKESLEVPYVEGMRVEREPYTDETSGRAIREGVGIDGNPLNYLMPRYSLNDTDLKVLLDYLRGLSPNKVSGVTGSRVDFATIVTPDADPVQRQAMIDVLNQYFTDQNAFAIAESPSRRSPQLKSLAKRPWRLHVWELSGASSTWEEQLRGHLADDPVYAAISGLGGKNWQAVHEFCEKMSLPCIFPNLELPVVAEHDFYSLYFSKGVLLEAELLAQRIIADKNTEAPRVVQIFRADDVGEAAAAALRAALARSGIQTIERPMAKTGDGKRLAALLRRVRRQDVLVLWLRAPDIATLANVAAPKSSVLMSGLMAGLDGAPLPAAWRQATHMAYPVDLPEQRSTRVDYALGWLALHHMPVVARQVQADTYVTCSLVMETLSHMTGSFGPDYLIERMEGMLEHQLITGYFPRLALAQNERFASKGGYIVHFANPSGSRVLPDADWRVP